MGQANAANLVTGSSLFFYFPSCGFSHHRDGFYFWMFDRVRDLSPEFGVAAGVSRLTWLAGLSSRSPLKDGWRNKPSLVQPLNAISQTRSGCRNEIRELRPIKAVPIAPKFCGRRAAAQWIRRFIDIDILRIPVIVGTAGFREMRARELICPVARLVDRRFVLPHRSLPTESSA
jgi:hypothetical protein